MRLDRTALAELRLAAEGFAAAVGGGAGWSARRVGAGGVRFTDAEAEAARVALLEALRGALDGEARRTIEAALGLCPAGDVAGRGSSEPSLEGWLERLPRAWLKADPGFPGLGLPDRRGRPGFLLDLLRAELGERGIGLELEVGGSGQRVASPGAGSRAFLPVLGGAWLGAMVGWCVELTGVAGAGLTGFGLGLALGLVLGLRLSLRRADTLCSECGGAVASDAASCPGCAVRLVEPEPGEPVEPGDEAPGPGSPGGPPPAG